jgi:hypothetical protein
MSPINGVCFTKINLTEDVNKFKYNISSILSHKNNFEKVNLIVQSLNGTVAMLREILCFQERVMVI